MAITLYMDHNVPRAITVGLRLRGVDVITSFEDGRHELDDPPWQKRLTDKKNKSHLRVLSTLISYGYQLVLVFKTWR